jgi:hypothetical protein
MFAKVNYLGIRIHTVREKKTWDWYHDLLTEFCPKIYFLFIYILNSVNYNLNNTNDDFIILI